MKNLILHGSFHVDNFGDILLMQLYQRWIKEIRSDVNVIIPTLPDELSRYNLYQNEDVHLSVCHGAILCGGGYFGEPDSGIWKWGFKFVDRHYFKVRELIKYDIPYLINGVGFGPITNRITRMCAYRILNEAESISVRDNESLEFIKAYYGENIDEIEVTADSVISIAHSRVNLNDQDFAKVGLHLSGNIKENSYNNLLNSIIEYFKLNNEYQILFIRDRVDAKDQIETYQYLKEKLDIDQIDYINPNKLIDNISTIGNIITSKLHVGILGACKNSSVISFPKHNKTIRFYNQIGEADRCIYGNEINYNLIKSKLDKYLNKPIVIDENIINSALHNKTMIERFIENL